MKKMVQLDDRLLDDVEKIAAERGRTLSSVIEEALREMVAHQPRTSGRKPARPVSLPTFRGEGLQPGVNLDDSQSLLDLMESAGAAD
ncbi:MAG: ribbon-helix-helix protein, CopG family [Thermoanaerobaculia bacterium]